MNQLYTRVTLLLGAALLFLPMQATAQDVSKAPTFRAHSSPQTVFSSRSGEIVFDGSFEEGSPNPVWEEASTNFGTPLCTVEICGSNPAFVPHTGDWWAWFGGVDAEETGSVTQELDIPEGSGTLTFWFWIATAEAPGTFEVSIDGEVVFSASEADAEEYSEYTEVSVDVSEFADGAGHVLKFESVTNPGGITNFFLDDVAITLSTSNENGAQAQSVRLGSAFPNPFAARTQIEFEVDEAQQLIVEAFDVLGRRVATLFDGIAAAGVQSLTLEAADLPAGLYIVQMRGEDFAQSRKVVLSR